MKATLTIEVPDDFKKGDCRKCELSESYYYALRCPVLGTTDYELCKIDCPLEIQEEKSCDGCQYLGRPTYDYPCSSCEHYNLYDTGE